MKAPPTLHRNLWHKIPGFKFRKLMLKKTPKNYVGSMAAILFFGSVIITIIVLNTLAKQ